MQEYNVMNSSFIFIVAGVFWDLVQQEKICRTTRVFLSVLATGIIIKDEAVFFK